MNKIIIPAVIAKTQGELETILAKIGSHADIIQLDIMDGRFVPTHSLDFDFKIPENKHICEAHLMVKNPENWIEENGAKVETIIVHREATPDPSQIITLIKEKGTRVSFALNPETPVENIQAYLDDIDQVLVMTVHPGSYGSKFLPETMAKIRRLRELRPKLDIEVDGGINPDTIGMPLEAGANMFVSGSYLVLAEDIEERIQVLKRIINT